MQAKDLKVGQWVEFRYQNPALAGRRDVGRVLEWADGSAIGRIGGPWVRVQYAPGIVWDLASRLAPFHCEDCNGTGMVPAIGPEDGEADGYVTCPTCREGGAA